MKLKKPTISQYSDKNEYQRQWRALNPDKVEIYAKTKDKQKTREAALKRRYDMSQARYDEMFQKQDGKCAICKSKDPQKGHTNFHIDHCHKTGNIRGLLCGLCNRGLGYFRDSPKFFREAAKYLESN